MNIPDKLVRYLEENKTKPKNEIIKEIMKIFGYKESTALTCYSICNRCETSTRDFIFKFLKENPIALNDEVNTKYAKELNVNRATYVKYVTQYKSLYPVKIEKEIDWEKYHKGRLRQKFIIDDSKLFG